jgi:DDE superfamily endonuclease
MTNTNASGRPTCFCSPSPLTGWRTIDISAQRTAVDWAHQITHLLDACYPDADTGPLVCDNLSTHKIASLYEAFAPEEARRLARRLELHDTPKHGSWLNIAGIELRVLTKQCLDRRIATIGTLR